jgi:hypothetical protein
VRTWNAAFVGSVIRGLLEWKKEHLTTTSFANFIADFRATLLAQSENSHMSERGSDPLKIVSPLSLIFSTLNKRPRAMLEELFGNNGALRDVIDPTQDLFVDAQLACKAPDSFECGDYAVPFIPRDNPKSLQGCFLVHALLRFAATAGTYRSRASFWKELAVLALDIPFFFPPSDPLFSNMHTAVNEILVVRWIVEDQKPGLPESSIVMDAHRVDLIRSLLESKQRGLVNYCAAKRQAWQAAGID